MNFGWQVVATCKVQSVFNYAPKVHQSYELSADSCFEIHGRGERLVQLWFWTHSTTSRGRSTAMAASLRRAATSRPRLQRCVQGSSPPSQSGPRPCPDTPCHRSVQQRTVLSDGPPGHGPSTPRWRRTPPGCPVVEPESSITIMCTFGTCVRWCLHVCHLCLCMFSEQ